MQKTAQKRSLLNKLRETVNLGGKATEAFSPEFKELLEKLRNETDDPVRAIVTGEQIGEASPPYDAISLKDLLKSAKSNVNRREYMKAVADLGRFHKKMNDVVALLSNFKSNIDMVHERFLFDGIDDESKQHLHDLKSRFAYRQNNLVKEANILDFFTNIATERGRALSGWEKRYPKQVGKLKVDTARLLGTSERLLSVVLSTLKELAQARSVRNPDKYIQSSDKIIREYAKYNNIFKEYYNSNVKGFLEKQELIAPVKSDELGKQDIGVEPKVTPTINEPNVNVSNVEQLKPFGPGDTIPMGPMQEAIPASNQIARPTPFEVSDTMPIPPPEHQSSVLPAPPPVPGSMSKMTPEEMKVFEAQHNVAHQKFYNSLKKMSNESPTILAMYINKYAKSIQSKDPMVAIQLFKIAKSINL